MDNQSLSFKHFIFLGLVSGVIWGLLALFVSFTSSAFLLEKTVAQNIIAFTSGGILFGVTFSCLFYFTCKYVPLKNDIFQSTIISFFVWCAFKVGGLIIKSTGGHYSHTTFSQNLQGLLLVLSLGMILGVGVKKMRIRIL